MSKLANAVRFPKATIEGKTFAAFQDCDELIHHLIGRRHVLPIRNDGIPNLTHVLCCLASLETGKGGKLGPKFVTSIYYVADPWIVVIYRVGEVNET